ncbi:MAG: sodium:solute symporter family protein, partial [Pseudomonadota bacterium]
FFLAEKLARSGQTTLPDQIGILHGRSAQMLATVLNFLNVVPIAYVLSLGLMVHMLTGWPIWLGILIGTSVAALYSVMGGFRAVVYTDLMQFALMCFAVALLMIYSVTGLGGAEYLRTHLPAGHLNLWGQISLQELFVWALIALSTLVDPNFYHRCYAAKSPSVARTGILCAVGFWMLFDVCTTFTGLYARAAFSNVDPRLSYVLLADSLLPSGLKGFFFAGMLATVMSTIDSYCFVGAMTVSHDLRRFWRGRNKSEDEVVVRHTRIGILITALIAVGLAFVFEGSIKSIWKTLGSLSTSAMLVPMVFGMLGWRPPGAGVTSMGAGVVGTLGWAAFRRWGSPGARRLEVMIPGLALSLLGYFLVGLFGSPKNKGGNQ